MAASTRDVANATAASLGREFDARARVSTSRVLRRNFSSMVCIAADSLAPWYSMAAQMTPPALAMKSGTQRMPRS